MANPEDAVVAFIDQLESEEIDAVVDWQLTESPAATVESVGANSLGPDWPAYFRYHRLLAAGDAVLVSPALATRTPGLWTAVNLPSDRAPDMSRCWELPPGYNDIVVTGGRLDTPPYQRVAIDVRIYPEEALGTDTMIVEARWSTSSAVGNIMRLRIASLMFHSEITIPIARVPEIIDNRDLVLILDNGHVRTFLERFQERM